MTNMTLSKTKKLKKMFIFLFFLFFAERDNLKYFKLLYNNNPNNIKIYNFTKIINSSINNKTILIFEACNYHYECMPGYAKYFIDLKFNVDIIMNKRGIDNFCLFENTENIRIFFFESLSEIYSNINELILIIHKYKYILLETIEISTKKLFEKLGFFKMNNTIFVLHNLYTIKKMPFLNYFYKLDRLWTLGNLKNSLQVNPHYFGNIKIKKKNSITRFFMTSTIGRNYSSLLSVAAKLKEKKMEFEIILIGRTKRFSQKKIPINIKKNFKFKYRASFFELYQSITSSDYIIIILDPNNKKDTPYINSKVTGSAQLVYGFLKPPIININFSSAYNMTNKNSFIYNKFNFYNVMHNAIMENNMNYKRKIYNLNKLSKKLYKISISNVKKTLNSIFIKNKI